MASTLSRSTEGCFQRAAWAAGVALAAVVVVSLLNVQQRRFTSREQAEQRVRLMEAGRQELLAGSQMRAAVFLSEAYRRGVDTPSTNTEF